MEAIDIFVEFASGITITDRAMFVQDLREVCVSQRLAAVIREFSLTEAPPRITATIRGHTVSIDQSASGGFFAPPATPESLPDRAWWLKALRAFVPQTTEQRQQFGRLMHTLSAASLIGAIGFWHSTSAWTVSNVLSEANLVLAFVITYYEGMVSMKGE